MPSLTSQLIISLIDKVSGPAKGAASALGNLAKAEKGLAGSAVKGTQGLAATIDKTAKAAANLNKTFASANWSKNFAGQLGKLDLTQTQIDRLRQSFEKFQNTLRAGGRIRASDFLPKLGEWERQTIGSLQRAAKAQQEYRRRTSRIEDMRTSALHLAAPYVGAHAALHGSRTAVEKAAELQREKVRQNLAGMTPAERASSLALSRNLSSRYTSVDQDEIMRHQRNLRSTLGDMHHAQDLVEDMVKAQVVLSVGEGGKDGAIRDLDMITKGLEGAGFASSPEKFRRMLGAFVKAKNLYGETVSGEDFRTYVQRAKTSKYGLSEEYMGLIAPYMMQHEGASAFGTAQATAFSSLVGERQTKAAKAKLRKFGLLDKNNRLIDTELFNLNPYDWAMQHLKPKMEKAGMKLDTEAGSDERGKAVDFLSKAFSNRNAGEFFAALLAYSKNIEQMRPMAAKAKGPEAAEEVLKSDLFQQWEAAKAQTTNVAQNILEHGTVISTALQTVADAMAAVAKRYADMGDTTKKVVANGVEGTAVVGGGVGAALLARKAWKWARGGGGKSGAAVEGAITDAAKAAPGEAAAAGGSASAAAARGAAGWLARIARTAPMIAMALGPALNPNRVMDSPEHQKWLEEWRNRQGRWDPPKQPFTFADTDKTYDVFQSGANPIQFLDQAQKASQAGEKSAGSYKDAFASELRGVDAAIQEAMARWSAMLGSFTASPTITPNIAAPAGAGKQSSAGGGQKVGSIDSPSRRLHGAFGDYGFDTV